MLDIFRIIADFIFPPHHSVMTLRPETTTSFLRHYSQREVGKVETLAKYTDKEVQAAIIANKFHNHEKAAALLASLLDHYLSSLPDKPTILVPIPLGRNRKRTRGYNQVERVLQCVTSKNCTTVPLLRRTKETTPQTSLARALRLENMTGVFGTIVYDFPTENCRLVIVDDVLTTGATLASARTELAEHVPKNCELICVALAH
jgi:ComF family protein